MGMSGYDSGPIRDKDGARICTLAGMDLARRSIITLRELDRGTELALQEVEAARTKAQFYDKALIVARFTKATCDAFISLAAELSGNKAAKGVADAYGVSSVGAGAVGDITAGKRVDAVSLVTDSLKASSAYAGPNAEYLMKNVAVKTELVRGAMNTDKNAVIRSSVEYTADLSTYTLDQLKEIEKDTKTGKNAGIVSKFVKIGKELFLYNDKVGEAFDQYLKDSDATSESFESQKLTLKMAGGNIRRRVRELEQFIQSCELELQQQEANKTTLPPLTRVAGAGASKRA
jgi:hypothetical protein